MVSPRALCQNRHAICSTRVDLAQRRVLDQRPSSRRHVDLGDDVGWNSDSHVQLAAGAVRCRQRRLRQPLPVYRYFSTDRAVACSKGWQRCWRPRLDQYLRGTSSSINPPECQQVRDAQLNSAQIIYRSRHIHHHYSSPAAACQCHAQPYRLPWYVRTLSKPFAAGCGWIPPRACIK
jgi:hypothetical protein|eukprot:COSAG06_NODE_330_length_17413_cov_12.112510_12_plen_177_part_00